MLTIAGLILNFAGTIVASRELIASAPNSVATSWGAVKDADLSKARSKQDAICGLRIIAAGFFLQLLDKALPYFLSFIL